MLTPLAIGTDRQMAMQEMERHLELILVSYRTPAVDVEKLSQCLASLGPGIGYSVVVNACQPGEPIEALAQNADLFLSTPKNLGYGTAVNWAVSSLTAEAERQKRQAPTWVAAMNTDLSWEPGSFERLLRWLATREDVVLVVPQILNPSGEVERLCKTNPSVLALISRRFIPNKLKPQWLRKIDTEFTMSNHSLDHEMDVEYLSGCCMIIRRSAFIAINGFDERFFLYLEDADISRSLKRIGRCLHSPIMQVIHSWGRGNHYSLRLTFVNIQSVWKYFRKWGWRLW
jgi:GT2 family glycosyltransferase